MKIGKKEQLLSIVLLIALVSPSFLAFSDLTPQEVSASQNPQPPSINTYSTSELYPKTAELQQPPPTPIWDEPPKVVYANQSLDALISQVEANKTIGKIPRNLRVANTSAIAGNLVEYEEPSVSAEGIVAPMSHEIIDSDTKSGSRLKVSAAFYKDTGEMDPNWDYYAVKATIEDIYAKNDFWNGPLFADIWLYFPSWCEEVPTNHKPEAGFRLSEGEGTFGYEGIGFSMKFPAYAIGYESSTTKYSGWLFVHWSYDGGWGPFAYWYYVFKDYTEASIGIRVPQGQKPYCYVAGWAAWYKFWIFVYTYEGSEMVKWVYVDPPQIMEHPEPPDPPIHTTPSTTPGPSPTITGTAVDGFLYVITFTDSTYSEIKYLSMSGMGQDYYGWHAGTYSWICLFAAVSYGGYPVSNAPVHFYLVDPNSEVYDLGIWYSDENGIAGCVVGFDPSAGTPQGMWWFIPSIVDSDIHDTCGFSYGYCLLITGYTYMACWNTVYIEDAFLVPENNVVELTATPKEGYEFKYWWINFYYECYANPIYIFMDFDCIVLARFDPVSNPNPPSSSGPGGRLGRLLMW